MYYTNLHYTRDITPKRVTGSGARLRGLALGQHRNIAEVATVSDLTQIEPKTSRAASDVFNHYDNWPVFN